MSAEADYNREYKRLNTTQKEAVDTIEGPVMVIAGPGTGKTQILTLRIANIMRQTDVPRDAILALTFTNAAAANMRKRLVSIVGSDGYRVSIFTFHSFANHIIESYPDRFSEIVGFSNISDVEQIDVIRSLLDAGSYELLKPLGDPYRMVGDILNGIQHLKKEGYTPDDFSGWLKSELLRHEARDDLVHTKGAHKGKKKVEHQKTERMFDKNDELARLYHGYECELAARKRYDFDDALLRVIQVLERDEAFLRELQEEYQYFLVDEHQDTNGAQNRILELLTTFFDTPNLFVVGDEKQAIFRFQGASLANFLYFESKFSNVKRITLTDNYRSHQGVLDAAQSLTEHTKDSVPAPLTAQTGTPQTLDVYTLNADDEELLFLAESVQKLLNDNVPPNEVCVLYRNNRDVEPIRDYFERLGIPFIVESGHGVLDDIDIRKLNTLLIAIHDLSNNDQFAKVLFLNLFDLRVDVVYELLRTAKHDDRSLYEVLGDTAQARNDAALKELHTLCAGWKKASENEPFLQFFELVVRESGLLASLEHSSFHVEKFDKLVRLFDEIKAHVERNPYFTLEHYRDFLTILTEHGMTLDARSRHVPNAVRLMTAHKAKGLEFDHVFVTGMYDGHWGGKRSRKSLVLPYRTTSKETGDDTDDERRLLFVAITRARKTVSISYSAQAPDGKERVPSQFLEEIRSELLTHHSAEDVGVQGKRPPLFVPRMGIDGKDKYLEYVRAHFDERGLSATALTSFLTCPWQWFYSHFFHSQFVKSVHQRRGTAVHKALQEYFDRRNKVPTLDVEYLIERFGQHLTNESLEPHEHDRVLRDSGGALRGWHAQYNSMWPTRTKNEFRIQGVLLDDVVLTGSLDKLECLDETCHEVDVIDYKTGKPKSRNHIEGKTKGKGAGDYKRQLLFYALLLKLYNRGEYRMREGVLDFVEPNERGIYKREAFTIEPSEVSELEDMVRDVAASIRNLSFWDTPCDDKECEYCALRQTMSD
jgi:DNA helicase-2/ATP-dependent DNA helicase PcrA